MSFWAWLERGEKYCKNCSHKEHFGPCQTCQKTSPWYTRCSILDLRPIEAVCQFSPLGFAPRLGGTFSNHGDGYRRASPHHYKNVSDDELRADIGCLRHYPWEHCDCKKTPCPICGKDMYDIMAICGVCWYKGLDVPTSGTDSAGPK